MPELPEVQTIADDLNKKIKGAVITGFWTGWGKAVKTGLAEFEKEIIGKKILEVKRRGKNLLFYLSAGLIMHAHLKMTGHLLVKDKRAKSAKEGKDFFGDRVNQYIRHIWMLKKNGRDLKLEFSDLRKFGKIRLLKTAGLKDDEELNGLGPEPLSNEFKIENLKEALKRKARWTARDILMDQSLIAGIGNIYASEILFEAGIMPGRLAGELKNDEVGKLYSSIKRVLKKAVKMRGTSDSDYRDTNGVPGGFQKVLKVYNREGRPCQKKGCRGVVKRERKKQRSAFFCMSCQK